MSMTENLSDKQLTPDDIDDLVKEICETGFCLHIEDQAEVDAYAALLSYRVQRDLYEVLVDSGDYANMYWDEFCAIFQRNQRMQVAAISVLKRGILLYCTEESYDFDLSTELTPFQERDLEDSTTDDAGDDRMNFIRLFPDEIGRIYVDTVMLHGQITQYRATGREALVMGGIPCPFEGGPYTMEISSTRFPQRPVTAGF